MGRILLFEYILHHSIATVRNYKRNLAVAKVSLGIDGFQDVRPEFAFKVVADPDMNGLDYAVFSNDNRLGDRLNAVFIGHFTRFIEENLEGQGLGFNKGCDGFAVFPHIYGKNLYALALKFFAYGVHHRQALYAGRAPGREEVEYDDFFADAAADVLGGAVQGGQGKNGCGLLFQGMGGVSGEIVHQEDEANPGYHNKGLGAVFKGYVF